MLKHNCICERSDKIEPKDFIQSSQSINKGSNLILIKVEFNF
jgi:hypothetical protein